MRKGLILLSVFVIGGCAGLIPIQQRATANGKVIYVGMSADALKAELGAPDDVSAWVPLVSDMKHANTFRINPRSNGAVEWDYIHGGTMTCVFLADGVVKYIGQMPVGGVQ